ncbi:hypothetical protein MTO98_21555 [Mucilaginibacter sp. SMC90]|uniref:hypothetical protein n=1 Tax=Mucilaginibacter sp. SMC90 TaxID=2929803 RepID=UPI001FB4C7CF|nr:hypothetical protein [Mucilaginibacter sp. SMC90]UOE46995.1 hypothetical protein MTO98_21555 [Mucilaginibacter sp. SMC90]
MNSLLEVIPPQFFIKVRCLCYFRLFTPDFTYKADSSHAANNIGNKKYWSPSFTANPQPLRQLIASASFKF